MEMATRHAVKDSCQRRCKIWPRSASTRRGWPFRGIRYLDATGRHQVRADLRSGPGMGVRRTELVRALRARADNAGVLMIRGTATEVRDHRETASIGDAEGRMDR